MLRRAALLRTDVSKEPSASFIRVTRTGELGTTLAVTNNQVFLSISSQRASVASYSYVVPSSPILVTLMKEALSSSEMSVLTRATRRNIPEDAILHSHSRGILKSYIAFTDWAVKRRRNVSPVRYELGFYIPEDAILHSYRRDNLKSYNTSLS
jgi:hypothetical protein